MKTFGQLLQEWNWGETTGLHHPPSAAKTSRTHTVGNTVNVNKPGDENHGKSGRIIRQQSTDYGLEMPHAPGKLHWYAGNHLHKPEPGKAFGRSAA